MALNSKNNDFVFTLKKGGKKNHYLEVYKIARDNLVTFDKIVKNINLHHSSNPLSTSSVSTYVTTTTFNISKATLNPLDKEELAWWTKNLELRNGRSMIQFLSKKLPQADASTKGVVQCAKE